MAYAYTCTVAYLKFDVVARRPALIECLALFNRAMVLHDEYICKLKHIICTSMRYTIGTYVAAIPGVALCTRTGVAPPPPSAGVAPVDMPSLGGLLIVIEQ